jgi:hypothetical protein
MKEKPFIHFLKAYKFTAESIFHTPKFDSGYRKAVILMQGVLSKTVSELGLAWEDTTNNEYSQLRVAEEVLSQYMHDSPETRKKEVIDSFKTSLIEKLNKMIYTREKESDWPKVGRKEN